MKLLQLGACLLMVAQALLGQSVLALADRQEMFVEGRVLRRSSAKPTFAQVPDLPEVRPSFRFLGRLDAAWDGSRVYQFGVTEESHRVVCVGNPMYTTSGERQWFWSEPRALPLTKGDAYSLLGAWEDSLLLLQTHRETKAKGGASQDPKASANAQSLTRVDLITGEITPLLEVQTGSDLRYTILFSQDAFYLFTATGKAIRIGVRTEPWRVEQLSSNHWAEAGVTLCKDTGEFQNPPLFGKAFLDLDGSILIPTQVFLPLDRADLDLAWSKLPQTRRAELIASGLWPVPADKEVGWKNDVRFLKFDPSTKSFTQAKRSRFEDLVVAEDRNFIVHLFREYDPSRLYTSSGGRILPLAEALSTAVVTPKIAPTEGEAAKKPKASPPSPGEPPQGKGAAKAPPRSIPTPVVPQRGADSKFRP